MSYSSPPAAGAGLPAQRQVLGWWQRLVLATIGAVLLVLLGTAAVLSPSPKGFGTHRQLGLPPCTVVQWYGIRCPSCGMTTSWANLTHGNLVAALRANVGGTMLAIVSAVCGPWFVASGVLGRWLGGPPSEGITLAVGLAIVVTTLIDWSLRLSLSG